MAEQPIRKEDIFDFEGTKKYLELIIDTLQKLASVISDDFVKSAKELEAQMKSVNVALKEDQILISEVHGKAELLAAQQKEKTKLDQETIRLKARLASLDREEVKELAKLKVAVEQKNKAVKDAARLDGSAISSVNQMRAKLKELTAEYNKLGDSARKGAAPAIKKLSDELKKAESAVGNNTRNVGNYSSALQGLPGPLGMAVSGMQRMVVAAKAFIATPIGIVIAAIAAVIGTLTAHFKRSAEGQERWNVISNTFAVIWGNILDIFGKVGKAIVGVFTNIKDLISGDKSLKEAFKDIGSGFKEVGASIKNVIKETKAEMAVAKELAELENRNIKRTREFGVERAKIEARINALREDAEKRDEYTAEQRVKFADEAIALQDKIYFAEKRLAEERLKIQRERNKQSDSSIEDLQAEADLQIALINLESERDKQQRSIIAKKQALLREELKEREALQAEGPDKIRLKQEENTLNIIKKYTGLTIDEIKERNEQEHEEDLKLKALKAAIVDESFAQVSNSLNALAGLFESSKQRELSAAGSNAEAREAIERKYAKKQQQIAISQALIDGAMTIVGIWRNWGPANPVLAAVFSGVAAAVTTAQVAIIKSQKFAHGGSGILEGDVHASGGVKIAGIGEAERGEHISITSRKMTGRYGGSMLDAVSNSINQGKFFEVWSNANKGMGVHQDIYTKKMYEMMRNTPTTYTDTSGATVKEYPDGRKFVIRQYN